MIKLSHEIDVFVPAANNEGKPLDFSKEIQAVIDIVGGATVVPTTGLWSDSKHLYKDKMKVTQFNVPDIHSKALWYKVSRLLAAIFIDGLQEAVSVKIDGALYILEDVVESTNLRQAYSDTKQLGEKELKAILG